MNDKKQLATVQKTMAISKDTLEDFLFSQCKNEISDEQKALFVGIALANNLNPYKREIYPIPFWNSKLGKNDMQPVTAYTVYLQKAQASGKLDGWETEIIEDDDGKVAGGKITIHRKDWNNPFIWEVTRDEIVQCKKDGSPNKNWNEKPKFMTKKTLIGQGMRLCFPEDIGGMPYLEEEIRNAQVIDGETESKKKVSLAQVENTEPVNVDALQTKSVKADVISSEQKKKINQIFDLMKYEDSDTKKKEFCKELYNKDSLTKFTNDEANNFIEKLKLGLKKRIITDRIYTLEELSSVIEIITDIYVNPNDQKLLEEIINFGETLTETKKEEPTTK
ncbi:phage recombination protein Bet [candidate division SR1 bacterium RAAC1_SR1_1]|nr:phage recombination protein Bet [candidate division SR1 bacterium RAAC1_SR1_1]